MGSSEPEAGGAWLCNGHSHAVIRTNFGPRRTILPALTCPRLSSPTLACPHQQLRVHFRQESSAASLRLALAS